jgi:hypothetical protein
MQGRGGRAHVYGVTRRVAQGAGRPVRGFSGRGARPTSLWSYHDSRVHSDGREAYVHRRARTVTRGGGSGAAALWTARAPLLFHLRLFKNAKLWILECNMKISINESCRATIGLQLLQSVTYVLVIRLSGIARQSFRFSRRDLVFIRASTLVLLICTQNLNVRQLWKLCSRKKRKTFVLAYFEVLLWNLENTLENH